VQKLCFVDGKMQNSALFVDFMKNGSQTEIKSFMTSFQKNSDTYLPAIV
jgi:hypothetical protein